MNLQEDLQNASRWLKIACSSTLHLPPTSPIFNVATISRLSTRDIIPLISSKKRVGTLDYKVTVCKGQKLNGLISDVLEGRRTPSHDYGPDDIRNGWSREGLSRGIPDTFDVPFKAIGKILPDVGERLPELSETHVVDLVQDMPFRNSAGKKQKPIPKKDSVGAHYEVYYFPKWNAMISSDARSPVYQVRVNHDFKISNDNVNKLIPPLNRQSDVMWAVWKTISPTPNNLRYIGRSGIINDDTKGIMDEIFRKGPTGKPAPWPGLTFGIDTEEAQALLATPNGLAIAYILIDRAKQLGRRKISVTIAASDPDSPGLGYRMLWDLAPDVPALPSLSLPGAALGLTFTSAKPRPT